MSNKLFHYKNESNIQLSKLVENDISYSVLYRILQNKCTDIFTDYNDIIICYSNYPYPVWVWCNNVEKEDNVRVISAYLKEYYLLKGNFNIILDNVLLNNLKKLDPYWNDMTLKMEMFSYQLSTINPINYPCDGYCRLANINDIDVLAILFKEVYYTLEGFVVDIEDCKKKVLELIENNRLYVWINALNEIIATTYNIPNGAYSTISGVYTIPKYRRKGYGINIVHHVTKEILNADLIPILYTNGNYLAANECYKKIGFKKVGSLCNIQNYK